MCDPAGAFTNFSLQTTAASVASPSPSALFADLWALASGLKAEKWTDLLWSQNTQVWCARTHAHIHTCHHVTTHLHMCMEFLAPGIQGDITGERKNTTRWLN